jgi:chromosome segregation ATPase
MESNDLNEVKANITAKVPYPIRMKIQEKAMRYGMTLNAYMNFLIGQLVQNEDLMNPERLEAMMGSIEENKSLRSQLNAFQERVDQLQADLESYSVKYKYSDKELQKANQRIQELEAIEESNAREIKAADDDYSEIEDSLIKSEQKVSELIEEVSRLKKAQNKLNERLSAANNKIAEDYIGFGKPKQF